MGIRQLGMLISSTKTQPHQALKLQQLILTLKNSWEAEKLIHTTKSLLKFVCSDIIIIDVDYKPYFGILNFSLF